MIDCFEVMYEECADHPKLMSLALHDRFTGRPGRITGLVKFLDRITACDHVWICTRHQIAEHWRQVHPS
jgi:allantoinase